MASKRIRVEVAPLKGGGWTVKADSELKFEFNTQADAITAAVEWCHAEAKGGALLTLKIKRPNGKVRDERTYPRGSDPKRSRG
jgi:hypothetical protein